MPIPKIITAAAESGRKPKTKRQMDNEANNEPQQQPKPQGRRGRRREQGEGRGSWDNRKRIISSIDSGILRKSGCGCDRGLFVLREFGAHSLWNAPFDLGNPTKRQRETLKQRERERESNREGEKDNAKKRHTVGTFD